MTKYLKIQNDGELDSENCHLMGVSSKRGDTSKIGFFGSGNKYGIAVLLREGISFSLYSGTKRIKIATVPLEIGGQTYKRILVDGHLTSLTTAMGPDWEPWYALREFYSNAIDEGGMSASVVTTCSGQKGKTCIFVELGEKLQKFTDRPEDYLLLHSKPLDVQETEYGKVRVYEAGEEGCIFYRKGMRITPENGVATSLYNYNFDDIQINESRTYKYRHQVLERAAAYFGACKDPAIIRNYLGHYLDKFEENMAWEYVKAPLSSTWETVLRGRIVFGKTLAMISGNAELKAGSIIVPDELAKKIAKDLPSMHVAGQLGSVKYLELEATPEEAAAILGARKAAHRLGYSIPQEIQLANFALDGILGYYHEEKDSIVVSKAAVEKGPAELLNTVLEEYFHSLGYMDASRGFVTFLINEVIRLGNTLDRLTREK